MIGILLITHGEFGKELIRSAISIVGEQERVDSMILPSTEGVEVLKDRLMKKVDELNGDGVLIFVDMPGSTAYNLAREAFKSRDNVEIISGVNLPMLTTALTRRKDFTLKEIVEKIIETGKKSIINAKEGA